MLISDSMRKNRDLLLLFLILLTITLCMTSCQAEKNYSVETINAQATTAQYKITVFGNDGSNLYETKLYSYPEFTFLDDGILQLRTGTGNVTQYQFFDVVKNEVSPSYENPKLIGYGKVIYMTFVGQGVQLVVRDIFDESVFYQSYSRDFSQTGVLADALISAKFLDENTLQVSYLLGENFEEVQEILILN